MAKLLVWRGTRRDGADATLALACTLETLATTRLCDRLAHNPEVARTNAECIVVMTLSAQRIRHEAT